MTTPDQPVGQAGHGMFDGFVAHGPQTARGRIFAQVAGQRPPPLLLHGYPHTHVT